MRFRLRVFERELKKAVAQYARLVASAFSRSVCEARDHGRQWWRNKRIAIDAPGMWCVSIHTPTVGLSIYGESGAFLRLAEYSTDARQEPDQFCVRSSGRAKSHKKDSARKPDRHEKLA